ncbi:unnamed protein product [Malus baccata var. baccata]
MSSLLFHLYILLAILVLYNLYTHIAIFLLPVSSVFPTQTLGAGATPYKFLMFTQQWPKAVNKGSGLPYFTIHGLWPSNGSKPLICKGTNFTRSKIKRKRGLEQKLNKSWPDVESGRNWGFWEKEYNKHGTCSEDIFDQTKYFELADEMWRKLNIAQMLKNRKIVPGSEVLLLEVVVCYDHDGKKVIDCNCTISRTCWSQNISYV